jgi:putative transposase
MGRPHRAEPTNIPLHLTARGVRRLPIFGDDSDYQNYADMLGAAASRFDWVVLGFALLPNHVHLVIKLERTTLSKGVHWLHSKHARRFNERHGFRGHAFDARFFMRPIESEAHLRRVFRYVALNPVAAGLCRDPAEWRWSSFATIAGERDDHAFVAVRRVRQLYGNTQADGARAYGSAVRSTIVQEMLV